MTWSEFGLGLSLLAMFVWAEAWRDRARRLQHERDIYRRIAKSRNPRLMRIAQPVIESETARD